MTFDELEKIVNKENPGVHDHIHFVEIAKKWMPGLIAVARAAEKYSHDQYETPYTPDELLMKLDEALAALERL